LEAPEKPIIDINSGGDEHNGDAHFKKNHHEKRRNNSYH
jgi:hypothetical protein